MKMKKIVLLFTALAAVAFGDARSSRKQSVYYAERMGEIYGLDFHTRVQIYNLHMKKQMDWQFLSQLEGSPGYKEKVTLWSTEYKNSILDLIGSVDPTEWKLHNREVQGQIFTAKRWQTGVPPGLVDQYEAASVPETSASFSQNIPELVKKRAVYYAENMGSLYGLDLARRQEIFRLQVENTLEWNNVISKLEGSPSFESERSAWSNRFRKSVLAVLGPVDNQVWKERNQMIREQSADNARLDSMVSDALIAKYDRGISVPSASATVPRPSSGISAVIPRVKKKSSSHSPSATSEFVQADGISDSTHRRSAHYASEAGREFGLDSWERKQIYDLRVLVTQCWDELAKLRADGRHTEAENYAMQVDKSFRTNMLDLIGGDRELQFNAFTRRMSQELKQLQ
jgi:hypothetical protein